MSGWIRCFTIAALIGVITSRAVAQHRWLVASVPKASARFLPVFVELYRGSGTVPMSAAAIQDTITGRLRAAGYLVRDLGDREPPLEDRTLLRLEFWPEGGARGEVLVECPRARRSGYTDGPNRAFLNEAMLGRWVTELIPKPVEARVCAPQ